MEMKFEMPEKFAKVLKNDYYKKNTEYSVTQLLKPLQSSILQIRYGDKKEYEIEDRLWSFFGTAFHDAMENAEDDDSIIEERLKYFKVSGKFDHFDVKEKTLYDFKFTSVWKAVYADESSMKDYQIQLSIYAWLLKNAGFEVEKIANILIFRDWKKAEFERGKYDISKPYVTVYHDILEEIDGIPIKEWIDNKISKLDELKEVKDEDLPECTLEERWAKPSKFAIMKNKNKKATKLFETEAEANEYIAEIKKQDTKNEYRVEERKGEQWVRCDYCLKEFCKQYQKAHGEE